MKHIFFTLLVSVCLLSISCGGDDAADCTSQSFSSEVNSAIDKVNTTGQAWATDPTSANCNAFINAANDYLDVVEGLDGCAGISQTDYDQAINSARAAINSLPGC